MDARQLSEVESWVDAYSTAAQDLELGTAAAVWAAYATIRDWYDPSQTVTAAGEAAGAVTRLLAAVEGLVGTYQSNVSAIIGDRATRGRYVPQLEYPRQGVTPRQVYDRPVWTYRDTIARGGSEEEAFAAARVHAEILAGTDALLAERDATVVTLKQQGAKRYRRVVRPELSASGACGLCIAASQQIYTVDDLLPVHTRCKCAVLPIIGREDPAKTMNAIDIEQLYANAGGRSRGDLARTRYRVDDHGELGPVLVAKDSTPVKKTVAWDDPVRVQKELDALLPVLASLEERARAGENVSGPLGYQRDRIAKLRGLLAA